MRTCYHRDLKKALQSETSGAGADELYVSPLWYFEELDFLRDREVPMHGVTSICSDEKEEAPVRVQSSKKFKKVATERTEFLKKATEHLETSKKQMDEAETYAKAWACLYRQMKPEEQLFAKQAVDQVMLLGRFGKLCFNYLHSPSSSPYLSSPHVSRTSSPFLSNDSQLYISTSSVSPTESTSRSAHFTSVPTRSPIESTSHSPRFISVPTGSPTQATSQTIEITPELHFSDANESQYTSVLDLFNNSQDQ